MNLKRVECLECFLCFFYQAGCYVNIHIHHLFITKRVSIIAYICIFLLGINPMYTNKILAFFLNWLIS